MSESKAETYARIAKEISAVIEGESSMIARYATSACLLNEAFDYFYWIGFYLVDEHDEKQLVIGPYQGSLGCLRIPFGKGVCGHVAATKTSLVVDNVHEFAGHIACDSLSNSEIVVPVLDKNGQLIAILDADSTSIAAFDSVDKAGLETICNTLSV